MDLPKLEYPVSPLAMPFEEWLEAKYTRKWEVAEGPDVQSNDPITGITYSEYAVWTWEDPARWLVDKFTFGQIGMALGEHEHLYMSPSLPRSLRDRAWVAVGTLFTHLFEPYVPHFLVYEDVRKSAPDNKELHAACFMWWDVSSYHFTSKHAEAPDHAAFLKIATACLNSRNPALQESAVHGLGEIIPWGGGYPEGEALLAKFIAENPHVHPKLLEYAAQAMTGQVL